jgi:serine/threonine protein kinase/tetratricopeptide (TPR) repeat protein
MGASECLSAQVLGSYAAGTLSEIDAETIAAHLNECGGCLARLDELARQPEPLVDALRGFSPAGSQPPELAQAVAAVLAGNKVCAPNAEAPSAVGTVVGGYRIVGELGRGGMGRVYRAAHPRLDQEVALKVLRPGMDSAPILARFEAERQALALMDHPHIARVSDGGVTEDGQPFFVMELVRGVPITRYCEEHRLGLRRRLELLIDVCQAVQHAHQKGVIHRDLKPSNILVAEYDERATPKVIDFGVARAIERRGDAETEIGMLVGTPEYMSPEQASLSSRDMDTRSDIYALGVLLYELLTGDTPISRQRVRTLPVLELLRFIREEDPPAPSVRASQMQHEGIPQFAIHKSRWKELDWITIKTLEKDPGRRYETASALADDLRRFLNDELVLASPPSKVYRLRKAVRRHRRALATAAAFLLLLVAGTVVSGWLAVQAREAQAQAEIDRDKAVTAGQQATDSAKEALAVLTFFQERVMAVGRPEGQDGGLGSDVTIRQAVDAAVPHIAEAFQGQPLVEASVRNSLGATYIYVGDPTAAIAQLERAWELRRDGYGPDHADTLEVMHDLAIACKEAGQIDRAESLLEQVWQERQSLLGTEHLDTLKTMNELADAYQGTGKLDQAVDLATRAVDGLSAQLGPNHADTLYATAHLSGIERSAGKFKQAVATAERAFDGLKSQHGDEHPITLGAMAQLGMAYRYDGQLDRAIPLITEALEIQKRQLGPNHVHTLGTMHNLALVFQEQGQTHKAIALFQQVLEGRKAKLPADHPRILQTKHCLAMNYQFAGRANEAMPLLEQVVEATKAKLGTNHPNTMVAMHDLAALNFMAGKVDRAIVLHEETRDLRLAKLGADHPDTLLSTGNLGYCYWKAKKFDLAISLLEDALNRRIVVLGPDHPHTLGSLTTLSVVLREDGQMERALSLLEAAVADRQTRLGKNHRDTLNVAKSLANVQVDQGSRLLKQQKFVEAEAILRLALAVRTQQTPDDWTTFSNRSLLGGALLGQEKYAEAEPLLVLGYEGMKQRESQIPPYAIARISEALERVVQLYETWGKSTEAAEWRKRLPTQKATPENP